MGSIDLDAAGAARDEARAKAGLEPPTITRGGRVYELTPVLFLDAADAWRRSDGRGFVTLILANPEEADDFIAGTTKDGKPGQRLEWADLNEILTVWRVESGESVASAASSTNGGTRSRRTSPTAE